MKLLVTGGAGYIGRHTVVELLYGGHEVVVVDNLSNSSPESLRRVEKIAGRGLVFVQDDLLAQSLLERVFDDHPIEAVHHFSGLKAVGESVGKPLAYYFGRILAKLGANWAVRRKRARKTLWRTPGGAIPKSQRVIEL